MAQWRTRRALRIPTKKPSSHEPHELVHYARRYGYRLGRRRAAVALRGGTRAWLFFVVLAGGGVFSALAAFRPETIEATMIASAAVSTSSAETPLRIGLRVRTSTRAQYRPAEPAGRPSTPLRSNAYLDRDLIRNPACVRMAATSVPVPFCLQTPKWRGRARLGIRDLGRCNNRHMDSLASWGRGALPEEGGQRGRNRGWSLFGLVMAGIDRRC